MENAGGRGGYGDGDEVGAAELFEVEGRGAGWRQCGLPRGSLDFGSQSGRLLRLEQSSRTRLIRKSPVASPQGSESC